MNLQFSERKQKVFIAVFFLILTIVGLWMGTDYGMPWDESSEQRILAQNLHEYAYQILGSDSSFIQNALAKGATLISNSVERDHGVAPYYPLAPIFFLDDTHLVMQIWHAYTWLLFMLGVIALYFLARELGANRRIASTASMLLYLAPRFFAEGHYNNKDVVLLALVLCCFAFAARLMRKRGYIAAILFSVAGAFAANVKIIGIFAWGLAGLAILWKWLSERKLSGRDIRIMLTAIASFLACYFLITPAMWNNPIAFFQYLISNMSHFSRWDGAILFEGRLYRPALGESLPWYYLPKMMLLTLPVPYLIFIVLGQVYAVKQIIKDKQTRPLLVALSLFWILPLGYAMFSNPLVYNGWRHFYFVYAGLSALGALGLIWLWRLVRDKQLIRIVSVAAVTAVFLTQAVVILSGHPYQYVYYNVLAGQVEGNYELDYWVLSTYDALDELVNSTARNQDLPLMIAKPETPPFLYPVTDNLDALPQDERNALEYTEEVDGAPYLIYNSTYATIAGLDEPEGYHKLISIQGYGHELVSIYEIDTAS